MNIIIKTPILSALVFLTASHLSMADSNCPVLDGTYQGSLAQTNETITYTFTFIDCSKIIVDGITVPADNHSRVYEVTDPNPVRTIQGFFTENSWQMTKRNVFYGAYGSYYNNYEIDQFIPQSDGSVLLQRTYDLLNHPVPTQPKTLEGTLKKSEKL